MGTDDWRAELKLLATEATQRFLVVDGAALTSSISNLKGNLSAELDVLAAAFEQNISAVGATVGMPVTLALAASEGSHWQRIHTAERIRARALDAEPGEDTDALEARRASHAREGASKRMHDFATSPDGRGALAADACRFLLRALSSADLSEAANELLRQGVVLTWSALEMLSRDLFETMLNASPTRILTILREPTAKHRLQSKFTLEELATAGFNLSASLGSLLPSRQDFSDFATVKAVMLPLLDSEPDVGAALDDKALQVLCQQRHLIVHR
ncbi:MAG TPA: hypothetical protein VMS93_11755 [Candidatus Saccharimonadales bacterium]|nr:hypothetical protein [Candidatus Saccharimonadales bacterium]